MLRKLTLARVCLYLLLVTAFGFGGLYAYTSHLRFTHQLLLNFLSCLNKNAVTLSFSRVRKSVYLEKFFSAFFFPGVSCGIAVLVQRLFLCPGLDLFFSCASFPNLEYTW